MKMNFLRALAIFLFAEGMHAQVADPYKKLRFGFSLGTHYSHLQVQKRPGIDTRIRTINATGLRLGVLMDWRLNRNWSLAPKAELAFNKNRISVLQSDSGRISSYIYPVVLELAAHLQYKIKEIKAGKLQVLLGPNWKLPLWDPAKGLQTARPDVAIDIGIGAELPTEYFTLAPELRYSWGLMSLYDDWAVRGLYLHSITLVLGFK